jgi:hypothetical protein
MKTDDPKECRTDKMGLAKVAVQCLNQGLCFASSAVVADSFRLRNRQLLVAANRWAQWQGNLATT